MTTCCNTSLVTICVPSYNSEKTIRATLESILGQSYKNTKIIVSDNASTDSTVAIVERYAKLDPRISVFRHSRNLGGEANFSHCIRSGSGDYTAIYHADDIYSPIMIEEQVEALEKHKAAGAVFSMAEAIDEEGRPLRTYRLPKGLRPGEDGLYRFADVFKAVLKYGNFFFCPGVMVRTQVYKNTVKKWGEEKYDTSSDLDVWFKILKEFPICIIDKPLLKYRLSSSSHSYRVARSRTSSPDIFTVLDDYIRAATPGLLTLDDLKNYELQRLRDSINRAFNLLLQDKRKEGAPLLSGLFVASNALHALRSFYHIKLLLYGWMVAALYLVPLSEGFKNRLFNLRFG